MGEDARETERKRDLRGAGNHARLAITPRQVCPGRILRVGERAGDKARVHGGGPSWPGPVMYSAVHNGGSTGDRTEQDWQDRAWCYGGFNCEIPCRCFRRLICMFLTMLESTLFFSPRVLYSVCGKSEYYSFPLLFPLSSPSPSLTMRGEPLSRKVRDKPGPCFFRL